MKYLVPLVLHCVFVSTAQLYVAFNMRCQENITLYLHCMSVILLLTQISGAHFTNWAGTCVTPNL